VRTDTFNRSGEVHCSVFANVVVITCSVKPTPSRR
jgi:hypothetical protein